MDWKEVVEKMEKVDDEKRRFVIENLPTLDSEKNDYILNLREEIGKVFLSVNDEKTELEQIAKDITELRIELFLCKLSNRYELKGFDKLKAALKELADTFNDYFLERN